MDQYDELEICELDADDPDVAGPQQLEHFGPIFDKFLEQQAENQYVRPSPPARSPVPACPARPLPPVPALPFVAHTRCRSPVRLVCRGKFKDVLDRPAESDTTSERSGARAGQGKSKQVAFQVPTGRTTVLIRGNEPRQVAWDCESVLSTYSNVYNHPAILDAGPARAPRIRIGQSGMPIGVLGKDRGGEPAAGSKAAEGGDKAADANDDEGGDDDDDNDDDDDDDDDATFTSVNAGQARQRQETPEEKRARKKAVKEQRKVPCASHGRRQCWGWVGLAVGGWQAFTLTMCPWPLARSLARSLGRALQARREEKKSTKAAFKSEQMRQEREQQQSRQQAVTAGVRL